MGFGDPSHLSVSELQLLPPRRPPSSTTYFTLLANYLDNQGKNSVSEFTWISPLDESFIRVSLRLHNRLYAPVLAEGAALEDVLRQSLLVLSSSLCLLGRPLVEVLEVGAGVWLGKLLEAKRRVGLESCVGFGGEGRQKNSVGREVNRHVQRLPQTDNMATPLLGQFLVAINGFVQAQNEAQLADYLVLEPPFSQMYGDMIKELRQTYPKGREKALEAKCEQTQTAAKNGADGPSWTPFVRFMTQYLTYLRDVEADQSKYLETYELLSELQGKANSALGHPTLGQLLLTTTVKSAQLVCRLAIGLDKQPGLIAQLRASRQGGEEGATETLPERAANLIRGAFVTSLNDRGVGNKPEGKKRGIYVLANLCLKILFQCRKTRNATQIFENIDNSAPPLALYPKGQRVTYLYYLGRFLFLNSHFWRAQMALQAAYDEAPSSPQCTKQRRLILVNLIASNIILGRFPSTALLSRPEAHGLEEHFLPICLAIQQGNLAAFRKHLDLDTSPSATWLLHFRVLVQLRNRCEVLVCRSLIRKVYMWYRSRPAADSRTAASVRIEDLVNAFAILARSHPDEADDYIDPDLEGAEDYLDPNPAPHSLALESTLSSLIDQSLLRGFVAHSQLRFAVLGAKNYGGDPMQAGFPPPWAVISKKREQEVVPGWKKEDFPGMVRGFPRAGPGMTISLSGVRPIGAG